jgi:hypothetical protein
MVIINLLVCYRFDWRMVTDVSEKRSASAFRIKQIEECHLKLALQTICRGFVPVVDSCFWLQWDDDSDVDAGCNVKYFVCVRCQ